MFINQILTKLKSLVYSKSETDSLLGGKANSSHTHTKSQITDFPTIPTKTSQLTNDSGFLTSHQSLSNYSTLANTVKSLSISGKTITVTPGSGNAYTLTTQDTNTTYSNFVKSGSGAKAGLVPAPSTTAGTTKYLREDGTWQVPPDHTYTVNNATLTIQKNGTNVATFTSNASSNVTCNITVPTKTSELTNNSGFLTSHQSLSNYSTLANTIKSLSISGKTITYTKGDNTTGTLTTQDNNTWTAMKGATSSANGSVGYVNAVPPKDGYNTKYLRADGTWQVPPDHTYTVNNATLTIQKNGSNVATFTANASSNVTANISVPTNTNQLTNGSGFITSAIKESNYNNNEKYCLLYGDLLIQFGTTVFAAQSGNVTFKKAFSSAPIVVVNYGDDAGFSSPCCLDEAYTTYFTVTKYSTSTTWRVNWIAIGRV